MVCDLSFVSNITLFILSRGIALPSVSTAAEQTVYLKYYRRTELQFKKLPRSGNNQKNK